MVWYGLELIHPLSFAEAQSLQTAAAGCSQAAEAARGVLWAAASLTYFAFSTVFRP